MPPTSVSVMPKSLLYRWSKDSRQQFESQYIQHVLYFSTFKDHRLKIKADSPSPQQFSAKGAADADQRIPLPEANRASLITNCHTDVTTTSPKRQNSTERTKDIDKLMRMTTPTRLRYKLNQRKAEEEEHTSKTMKKA